MDCLTLRGVGPHSAATRQNIPKIVSYAIIKKTHNTHIINVQNQNLHYYNDKYVLFAGYIVCTTRTFLLFATIPTKSAKNNSGMFIMVL